MKLAIVLALALQTSSALAQTEEEVTAALNNVQHEMSRCIAYNTIVAKCIRYRDGALADNYDKVAEHLLQLSSQIGGAIGMTQDAMNSRMTFEWSEMDKLIQHDCVNISSLSSHMRVYRAGMPTASRPAPLIRDVRASITTAPKRRVRCSIR